VIGAGNTGHAAAAYVASRGGKCRVLTRCPDKAEAINKHGIAATGTVEGLFKVDAFTDVSEAVKDADVILVMTTSDVHREVCRSLRPVLESGQSILIFNGNWGAFEFKRDLGRDIAEKELIVAETGAQLFMSSSKEPGKVHFSIKEQVSAAATDPKMTIRLIDRLSGYIPQLAPVNSIYETSLSSTNPVIHAPITLLNIVRVENGQRFNFYDDGLSPSVINMILAIDAERIALARALGCEISDVLSGINSFWEIKHDNLFDALHKNEQYLKALGPASFDHRYFTEDIPYGIVPISKLGRIFDVATPHSDLVVNAFSVLLGKDYMKEGVSFSKVDFA